MTKVKKITFSILLVLFLSCGLAGCVPLIVGGAVGAVGGYAVSKDTIQGDSDIPYDSLWNGAIRVAQIRGKIRKEDMNAGIIQADMESSIVWIKLSRLTQASTRIRVSARKYHFPNLALAQDVYVKIMDQSR